MFFCNDDWYRKIIYGFLESGMDYDSNGCRTVMSLLAPSSDTDEEREELFNRLSGYLIKLWRDKCCREVFEFLICARGEEKIDIEKLDSILVKKRNMEPAVELSIKWAERFEEEEIFNMNFRSWAELVYSKEILGFEIDLDKLSKEDIDRIAKYSGDNAHFYLRPLVQFLVSHEMYELLWYAVCRHVISSLCRKDCRRDKRISEYISLYIGELGGVLWSVGQVSGEVEILYEGAEAFFKILAASKVYDNKEYRKAVNELLFKDAGYYNLLKISGELPESLLELFQKAIYNNGLIRRNEEEFYCSMLVAVMTAEGMYEKAAEFICSNKEYFNFDSLSTMLIAAVVALSTQDFDTVNMLYGIFLTEKTHIDRLRNSLSIYTREASALLLDVYNCCHHDHEYSFYANCARNSELENMDENRRKMFEKNTKLPIDSFKNKFFVECDVLNLCKKTELADDFTDKEVLELSKKLWAALKCICDYGSLKSVKDGRSIYFVWNTMDMNAALDYEHNIETNFITDEIISRGRRFLNRFDLMNSKINNLKYRTTYSLVNDALAQKAAYLYAENMSEVISDIIKDKPAKYRELLKDKWEESKAEKLFIRAFKEHENTAEISNYTGRCFISHSSYRSFDNKEKARSTGLLKYFEDSYINAGEKYGEILDCPDARRLLLTAEWLWDKECENLKDIHSAAAGHEFTYLVANYLKAVEVFWVHRLEKASAKCKNDIMVGQVNRNLPKIKVGSEGWREMVTMGNLSYCVKENPELLDPELHAGISAFLDKYNLYPNSSPVSIYFEDFINNIRNGYFHKHTLLTFDKASEIRGRALFVLRRITADIK